MEIEEVMPLYLCNQEDCIDKAWKEECGECVHTSNEQFAKNQESVELFKKFCDTFSLALDENGRLIVWENEGEV